MHSSLSNHPEKIHLVGLPSSPRPQRQNLSPTNTTMNNHNFHSTHSSYSHLETSSPTTHDKPSQQVFIDTRVRNRDSLIFANATIPLSPTSSMSSSNNDPSSHPLNGLVPQKRNGFARLFCCFGRDARARRRFAIETEYEKVGDDLHWSEY